MAWINVTEDSLKSPIVKFLKEEEIRGILNIMEAKPGDLILIVGDEKPNIVYDALGQLRLEIAKTRANQGKRL